VDKLHERNVVVLGSNAFARHDATIAIVDGRVVAILHLLWQEGTVDAW
jgi:hypothetical protein